MHPLVKAYTPIRRELCVIHQPTLYVSFSNSWWWFYIWLIIELLVAYISTLWQRRETHFRRGTRWAGRTHLIIERCFVKVGSILVQSHHSVCPTSPCVRRVLIFFHGKTPIELDLGIWRRRNQSPEAGCPHPNVCGVGVPSWGRRGRSSSSLSCQHSTLPWWKITVLGISSRLVLSSNPPGGHICNCHEPTPWS